MATNLGVKNGAPFYDDETPLDTHTVVLRDGLPVMMPLDQALVEVDRFTIERSVDDGASWELVLEAPGSHFQFSDYESKSRGVTLYRVTTYADTGAATVREFPMPADSYAIWIGGGVDFTQTARLPYSPQVGVTASRERVLKRYSGRSKPVVHSGEAVTRTVDTGGKVAVLHGDTARADDLERIAVLPEPVHLYRDPDGRVIPGMLESVQLTRENYLWWAYSFTLTETEK